MKLFEKGELKLLWPFYLEYFLASLLYLIPAFMVVYLINLNLTFSQIGILMATIPLTQLIFEIPTGAVADLYGRKFSVIIGYVIEGISMLSLFFIDNYYLMLIIFSVWGIGSTFSSGSKDAWIVDMINKKNKKLVGHFFGKMSFIIKTGLTFSGLLGVFLVKEYGLNIIWIATFCSYIISIILLYFFTTENYKRIKVNLKQSISKVFYQSKESISYSIKHPVILYLLISGFFIVVAVAFSDELGFIKLLKELGMPEYAFGYFWSIYCFIGGVSALYAKKILGKHKERNFIILTTGLASIILATVYFTHNLFIALGIIIISSFFYCVNYPIQQTYLHKFVQSKRRATVGSFQSMVFELASIIALPIGGYLIDKIGAKGVILVSALLGIPAVISYLLIKEKKDEKQTKIFVQRI